MSRRRLLGARLRRRFRKAVQRVADPEDGTMTLRFIAGRVLRELIELAERDADAELGRRAARRARCRDAGVDERKV